MILGISCLLIGLVAIVILQILKSNYIEGFVYNNGAGCKENKCKLTKSKISEADYKEWCDQCDNCLWDDVAKDCNPNPDYVEPEESDTPNDPCAKPCTQITGERACNGCPSCISCVDRDTGNTCIDRKDYTDERCPDTDPTDGLAPPGSNIDEDNDSSAQDSRISNICKNTSCDRIEPKDGTCDKCPNCKSCWPEPGTNGGVYCIKKNESCPAGTSTKNRKYYFDKNGNRIFPNTPTNTQTKTAKDVTPEEIEDALRRMEKLHKENRNLSSDDIDYSITESEETSVAKEKNRQAKFLQDFQSIVHNELLNEQGMTTANSQPYLKEKKDRLSANSKPNQKKGCPDMSEYVRKDSIPCWGCNLD